MGTVKEQKRPRCLGLHDKARYPCPFVFQPVPTTMPFALSRCLLPFSLLLLGACTSTPPSSISVSEDRQCPLSLHSGQKLIVSLPSNPATGYRWSLQDASAAQLKSLGPEVFSTPDSNLVGGDGISTWRFEARDAGSGRLLLTYQRPWETDVEPAGLFDCRIEVR